MPTKDELVKQASQYGIDPGGLNKAQLEEALKEAGYGESGDSGNGQGMDGQSEPHYPQERRNG